MHDLGTFGGLLYLLAHDPRGQIIISIQIHRYEEIYEQPVFDPDL